MFSGLQDALLLHLGLGHPTDSYSLRSEDQCIHTKSQATHWQVIRGQKHTQSQTGLRPAGGRAAYTKSGLVTGHDRVSQMGQSLCQWGEAGSTLHPQLSPSWLWTSTHASRPQLPSLRSKGGEMRK